MDETNLRVGMTATIEDVVVEKTTAKEVGSGGLEVFSTPSMIALMEKASLSAVEPHLPSGFSTVGTMVNITHIAATPIGMKVRANAELIKVEERKLTFKIEAFDGVEKIGDGTHERFIINSEKFRKKVNTKV